MKVFIFEYQNKFEFQKKIKKEKRLKSKQTWKNIKENNFKENKVCL